MSNPEHRITNHEVGCTASSVSSVKGRAPSHPFLSGHDPPSELENFKSITTKYAEKERITTDCLICLNPHHLCHPWLLRISPQVTRRNTEYQKLRAVEIIARRFSGGVIGGIAQPALRMKRGVSAKTVNSSRVVSSTS